VPPETKTRGELLPLADLPASGTQNIGKPSANEGGGRWWRGLCPLPGVWGMCPQKLKQGASCYPLPICLRVGPKTWQTLSKRGWGRGWRGLCPLPGGLGDVPPETKTRGELLSLANLPASGTQNLANPQQTRVGKGVEGALPPPRGSGGCAPSLTI